MDVTTQLDAGQVIDELSRIHSVTVGRLSADLATAAVRIRVLEAEVARLRALTEQEG